MAEFQDVMRQWNRMCGKQRTCYTCPAYGLCSPVSDLCTDTETMTALEEAIMRWAEEHPEPIYPTWFEFVFCKLAHRKLMSDHDLVTWMDNTPIPADIAQRLGLKPKEG